ncbi:MAG TPA: LON peptidase substrate-binding domain-containing protein, partial [Bacteroidota bacterium]|nr:LON peptidase substrate-binding domain-containing protein [Bacteroidota bacterium]
MAHDRTKLAAERINPEGNIPTILPVVPLRDIVVFPYMTSPVLLGRESSLKAVTSAVEHHKYIFLTAQKNAELEDPTKDDIFHDGTVAKIIQMVKLPNGLIKIVTEGVTQASIVSFAGNAEFLEAQIKLSSSGHALTPEIDALIRQVSSLFAEYTQLNRALSKDVLASVEAINDPHRKLFTMAASILQSVEVKQKLLQVFSLKDQYYQLARMLTAELDVLRIEKDIDLKVHDSIQKSQKKFLIQEQIRILQDELGSDEVLSPELAKLKEQIEAAQMPAEVLERTMEEFTKLRKTPPQAPEFGVGRNYIDWLVAVPWYKRTTDNLNIKHVEEILNADHFGLEKPKQRILEHIAVLNLVKEMRGQILCFVGPPGVGKTSLGKSISRALERKFVRISLGGVRDEAEIHGHRRTYIGSMPGKIIQSMKRAGVVNPIILMDEIDKMSMDFRGDPSSALLEVLDPEQNHSFNDHYLDVDYDLSQVMFITTANVRHNIPIPLQDRMEIIELPGYLEYDKREIAKRHIIPKQLEEHGLKKNEVRF